MDENIQGILDPSQNQLDRIRVIKISGREKNCVTKLGTFYCNILNPQLPEYIKKIKKMNRAF